MNSGTKWVNISLTGSSLRLCYGEYLERFSDDLFD